MKNKSYGDPVVAHNSINGGNDMAAHKSPKQGRKTGKRGDFTDSLDQGAPKPSDFSEATGKN